MGLGFRFRVGIFVCVFAGFFFWIFPFCVCV